MDLIVLLRKSTWCLQWLFTSIVFSCCLGKMLFKSQIETSIGDMPLLYTLLSSYWSGNFSAVIYPQKILYRFCTYIHHISKIILCNSNEIKNMQSKKQKNSGKNTLEYILSEIYVRMVIMVIKQPDSILMYKSITFLQNNWPFVFCDTKNCTRYHIKMFMG